MLLFDVIKSNKVQINNTKNNILPEILKQNVTPFCMSYCPRPVIGCGLSHLLVAKQFLNNDLFDFCLILEDDVTPIYTNLNFEINKCVESMKNTDWDIIKVYYNGLCNYNTNNISILNKLFTGSIGAYILSKMVQKN